MKIHIKSPTTFVITEQSRKKFKKYVYQSSTCKIAVAKSCYPEVIYHVNTIAVFVRGDYTYKDYEPLRVKDPRHMPHILKALKKFCTFNDEPFEIESCIL